MENKEDRIEPVLDKVEKSGEDLGQRLDAVEKKTQGIYDLNTEALHMIADILLFLDNLGKLDNWFYSSVRSKIIHDTHAMRYKFVDLLERHQKVLNP